MSARRNQTLIGLGLLAALAAVAALLLRSAPPAEPSTPEPPRTPPQAAAPPAATAPAPPAPAPAAATATSPARLDAPPEVVFSASWGSAPGQLGRKEPAEGAPEGPMSFFVTSDGRVWVLDQVNRRLQVFADGKLQQEIALLRDTYQDLVIDRAGHLLLLDRLRESTLTVSDAAGEVLDEISLVGPGVDKGAFVTGLFAREDGAWVERDHHELIRIADAAGKPDPTRPRVSGRFSGDGASLLTARRERPCALVFRQPVANAEAPPTQLARLCFDLRLGHIVTLESDAAGRVYLVVHLVQTREVAPFDVLQSFDAVVILAPDGAVLGRLQLPSSGKPWEQFRSVAVTPEGVIYQLGQDDQGATMRRWRPW